MILSPFKQRLAEQKENHKIKRIASLAKKRASRLALLARRKKYLPASFLFLFESEKKKEKKNRKIRVKSGNTTIRVRARKLFLTNSLVIYDKKEQPRSKKKYGYYNWKLPYN